MSPEELRDAMVRAMNEAALKARTENPDISDEEYDAVQADAALAVVREAMREPSDDMLTAIESVQVAGDFAIEVESRAIYAAMLAASPLREPGE